MCGVACDKGPVVGSILTRMKHKLRTARLLEELLFLLLMLKQSYDLF